MNLQKTLTILLLSFLVGGCYSNQYDQKLSDNELRLKVALETISERNPRYKAQNSLELTTQSKRIVTLQQRVLFHCSKDQIDSKECQDHLDQYVSRVKSKN